MEGRREVRGGAGKGAAGKGVALLFCVRSNFGFRVLVLRVLIAFLLVRVHVRVRVRVRVRSAEEEGEIRNFVEILAQIVFLDLPPFELKNSGKFERKNAGKIQKTLINSQVVAHCYFFYYIFFALLPL